MYRIIMGFPRMIRVNNRAVSCTYIIYRIIIISKPDEMIIIQNEPYNKLSGFKEKKKVCKILS